MVLCYSLFQTWQTVNACVGAMGAAVGFCVGKGWS